MQKKTPEKLPLVILIIKVQNLPKKSAIKDQYTLILTQLAHCELQQIAILNKKICQSCKVS